MAFGVGSIVLVPMSSADLPENATEGPDINPQPYCFGVVLADASTSGALWNVLWDNGNMSASVPTAALQDLYTVSAGERTRLWGKICSIANETEDYNCQVIAMYRRGSAVNAEKALVCEMNTGVYREVRCSALVAISGR